MAKYQHSFALKLRFYIFQFLVILTFFLQVPSKFRSRVWKILCGYWLLFDFVDLSVFRSFSGMLLLFWLGWLNNSNSSDTFRLASLMRCWRGKEKNTGVLSILTNTFHLSIRLFRSARTSCRTFEFPVPSVRPRQFFQSSYIQAYMPYESSEVSSNQSDGTKGSHRCPLDPLGPCRPTPWPPGTL